jgi:hypothetical protein
VSTVIDGPRRSKVYDRRFDSTVIDELVAVWASAAVRSENRRIMLSSVKPPTNTPVLEPRIRSSGRPASSIAS